MKIKELIARSPVLYSCLKVIKNRHNKDYLQFLDEGYLNPNLIEVKRNPEGKGERGLVCEIEAACHNDGFFASVRWALDGLYFCDQLGFIPVVQFSKDSLYYDEDMCADKDPFEYYYKQPAGISVKELEDVKAVAKCGTTNRMLAEALNHGTVYGASEEYICEMSRIMKEYLQFNDDTKEKIEEQILVRKINDKVLGVHIRGTDYKKKSNNHPVYVEPQMYYRYIDEAMKKNIFDKIFIATDDEDILNDFLKHYGEEKILYAKNITRGNGQVGIHTTSTRVKGHKYQLGLEVLYDMCSLAKCGGIISSTSQVSLMSRIYKKSLKEEYLYDKTINLGIIKNTIEFEVK